jgi:hypothetical protein
MNDRTGTAQGQELASGPSHIGPLLDVHFVETAPTRRQFGDLQRKLDAS